MGRKRNQGRARKAAKAKAKQEAEEREERENNQTATDEPELLTGQILQLQNGIRCKPDTTSCEHGADHLSFEDIPFLFVKAFVTECYKATRDVDSSIWHSLVTAHSVTMDEFANVWNDATQAKMTVSYFLFLGTEQFMGGFYNDARAYGICARYLEQHIAVELKRTRPVRICSDIHTLAKYFRHRIPCSCLDEEYEEVKDIVKVGFCYNPECDLVMERSKTMYCSRCRNAVYCSRECQVAHSADHKSLCDKNAAKIAEFNAMPLSERKNCIP